MKMKGVSKKPIHAASTWIMQQPSEVKAFIAVFAILSALLFIKMMVEERNNLFIAAESVHAIGISVLIYKLSTGEKDNCSGLSLKSQELTATFLTTRLYCSFVMEYDIHTILDLATLAATAWVIYMIRYVLNSSSMVEKDDFPHHYMVLTCAVLSVFIHPTTPHHLIDRMCWAFSVYMEAVSVLPQLHVMQNTQVVEPFTSHYVFALGVARFLTCAHWILQVLETRGRMLTALGHGLWPCMVIFSEIVQTFILADFCYYYVKSIISGQHVLRLPAGVV